MTGWPEGSRWRAQFNRSVFIAQWPMCWKASTTAMARSSSKTAYGTLLA
jgi:hypothetical protein